MLNNRSFRLFSYFLIFVAGFLGVQMTRTVPQPTAASSGYRPEVGSEVVLVLWIDAACGWSTHPELPGAWKRLVLANREMLPDSMNRVHTIGVVSATTTEEGLALLAKFGSFNEIVVGGSLNTGTLRYTIADFRGINSTPQVIVSHRTFARRADGSFIRESEVVVQRIRGLAAIQAIAARLASLDETTFP